MGGWFHLESQRLITILPSTTAPHKTFLHHYIYVALFSLNKKIYVSMIFLFAQQSGNTFHTLLNSIPNYPLVLDYYIIRKFHAFHEKPFKLFLHNAARLLHPSIIKIISDTSNLKPWSLRSLLHGQKNVENHTFNRRNCVFRHVKS